MSTKMMNTPDSNDDLRQSAEAPTHPVSAAHAIAHAALAEAQQKLQQKTQIKAGGETMTGKEDIATSHLQGGDKDSPQQQTKQKAEASVADATATTTKTTEASIDQNEGSTTTTTKAPFDLFGTGRSMLLAGIGANVQVDHGGGGGGYESGEIGSDLQLQQKLQDLWRFAFEDDVGNGENDTNVNANGGDPPSSANKLASDKLRFQRAYHTTFQLVGDMVDAIVQDGLHAYHQLDQTNSTMALLQETVQAKDNDLTRLRDKDAKHRQTIQNLLRALANTKTEARDASQSALMETQLRSQVTEMTQSTEQAKATTKEEQKKRKAAEDELAQTKAKLVQLERDRRAVSSWAKSMDQHMSSDTDFYKRKVRWSALHVAVCGLFYRYLANSLYTLLLTTRCLISMPRSRYVITA